MIHHGVSLSDKKLRIAIITNRFWPDIGGAETNIFYQAKLLAKTHDVTVFCPRRSDRPHNETIEGFTLNNMTDVLHLNASYPIKDANTLCPSIAFELLSNHFDIVQCFPSLNKNNKIAFLISQIKNIPFILCFFDYLDYNQILKDTGKINPDILKTYFTGSLERWMLKNISHCFAISEKEVEFLKQYNENVSYSPVPVLLEEYVHEYPDPKEKYNISGFTFLCLGRISFIKGQDIALKAFLKAFKEMPGSCLVFVGREDFEPDFFAHLKEIIPPELVKRIVFTGVVPREEVIAWLQHADMHVIPVRFMNSGAVVVETWAAKTPVLQSDVVDPNLVVEGKNGYLFKSENVDDLADQMLKTYQNKNMLSEMAQNGYELVKKKYSYAALLQLYQDTYDKILNH